MAFAAIIAPSAHAAHAPTTSCEIFYSPIPDARSGSTTGQPLLSHMLALDDTTTISMFRDLMPVTTKIIRAVPIAPSTIELGEQRLISGGYEGITAPSIVINFTMDGPLRRPVDMIAAAIGYVFIQDSVLVECSAGARSLKDQMVEFDIRNDGADRYIPPLTIRYLYGLLIAEFNQVQNLGYSYDETTGLITVLRPKGDADASLEHIRRVLAYLNNASRGRLALSVSRRIVEVSFPHNDWGIHPRGKDYLRTLRSALSSLNLAPFRARYVRVMHQYDHEHPRDSLSLKVR